MDMEDTKDLVEFRQGEYWRAKADLSDEGIPAGRVLMLRSIRSVDNEAHTLILAGHPQSGYTQHRFLVQDFLEKFEPVSQEEAARVRDQELGILQRKLLELQGHMTEVQANPRMLAAAIEPGIREWEAGQKIESGTTDNLPVIDPNSVALVPTMTEADVNRMKLALARRGEEARLTSELFKANVKEISETVEAMVPFMQERADAALARTEDIRAYVARLSKGIASLDLYIGKDVNVLTIKSGESAPDTVPLSVLQSKLYLDEELAVWHDVDVNFDYRNIEEFREVLAESPGLVAQMFPTERSIICVATTRQHKEYGDIDPTLASLMDRWNREVFLLVRDGENLYQMVSPIETHLIADRLFPSKAEIDQIFEERKSRYDSEKREFVQVTEEINFMDTRYTDRLEKHEDKALHYKRFLVMMAGLDHRMNLFGRFHNMPQSMAFITPQFQAQFMKFIHNDEFNPLQLPGAVAESFDEYASRMNENLRSGSRVLCRWKVVLTPHSTSYAKDYDRASGFYLRVDPIRDWDVVIAYRAGTDVCVKAPVKLHRKEMEITARISVFQEGYYTRGHGYLVLDRVKADVLDAFIHNRVARKEFLEYIRIFKAAVHYLRGEEERQKPTRHALLAALRDGGVAEGPAAEEVVDQAIQTWRAANRGAELPAASDPRYKQLLNQMFELLHQDRLTENVEAWAAARDLSPLRLTITGNSKITLYAAPKPEERDDRLYPHAWVHRIRLRKGKTGILQESDDWALLPKALSSETTLKEWPGVEEWAGRESMWTFGEKQAFLAMLDLQQAPHWLEKSWDPSRWEMEFGIWKQERDRMIMRPKERSVVNPRYSWTFAVMHAAKVEGEAKPIGVLTLELDAHRLLMERAPSEEAADRLRKEFARWYKRAHQEEMTEQHLSLKPRLDVSMHAAGDLAFVPLRHHVGYFHESVKTEEFNLQAEMKTELDRWARNRTRWSHEKDQKISWYIGKAAREMFFGGEQPEIPAEEED